VCILEVDSREAPYKCMPLPPPKEPRRYENGKNGMTNYISYPFRCSVHVGLPFHTAHVNPTNRK